MEKRTLKFSSLFEMARFAKIVSVGYLMNTNNFTVTGKIPDDEIELAVREYKATQIQTTDKVFSYGSTP